MKRPRSLYEVGLLAVLGVAVLGSTLALTQRSDYAFLDPIIEVKQLISSKYVDSPDLTKLQQGAIGGMIEALNDPYTIYVPPAQSAEFTKQLTGEYVGIGASVNIQDGWLTVVSPLEDSPAFRAGLMPEDRVVEIEGKSTHGLTVEQCVELLMGEAGTVVNISVERHGQKLAVPITRERIKTRNVKGFHREDADGNRWMYMVDPARKIAYVRLTQFTPRCSEEIGAALSSLGADKGQLKGLVLDLRFNPGGVLSEAVGIADMFLKNGVIVSTRGRSHEEEVAKAHEEGTLPDFPLAVLVNNQSASASEVLAGALVENKRAIIIGQRSFGKGSVQTVHPLEQKGAELKLTEQGYYLPSGRSITRKDDSAVWGVDPTDGYFVPMSDAEVRAMLDVRRELDLLRSSAQAASEDRWTDAEWVLNRLKDKQLTAAVHAVQGKIDSGEWVNTGEPGPQAEKLGLGELARLQQVRLRLERELLRADNRIDTLERAVGSAASKPEGLIPEQADLTGGEMILKDKNGAVVATLEITANTLSRWLVDADLKRKEPAAGN